ncbi:MAG: C40 family peptidase [Bacteroidaceae bacterium]|nr:C40 family peptidase [Bacteroidaceae bacterium]
MTPARRHIPCPTEASRKGGFLFATALVVALLFTTACTTQRLPDGAYLPARARMVTASLPATAQPVVAAAASQPRPTASQTATAARALGIEADATDDARLLTVCASYLGTPYKYAGNDREGIDCSGLTTAIYREVYGIGLHRRSLDQHEKDVPHATTATPRQGDLLFFTTNGTGRCSHVGVYLKDQRFIHASTRRGVVVDDLRSDYYRTRFLGGGRP